MGYARAATFHGKSGDPALEATVHLQKCRVDSTALSFLPGPAGRDGPPEGSYSLSVDEHEARPPESMPPEGEVAPRPANPTGDQPSNKTDAPHWISIALSVVALVASCLSAWFSNDSLGETRRNREINEITSRAYITLSSLLLDSSTLYKRPKADVFDLVGYLTVINTGRTEAKLVRIEPSILRGARGQASTRFDGGIEHVSDIHRLAPGASQTIRLTIPVVYKNGSFDRHDPQWAVDFTIAYNDGIHSGDRVDIPLLCAVIPEKPQKTMLTFYACNQEIYEIHEDKKR